MAVLTILLLILALAACWVPRDPCKTMFLGALIGGAFSLLGAKKERDSQKEANEANRPVNQVKEWVQAGINPIAGITSGANIPHRAASIGDNYAQAGALFGQGLDQHNAAKIEETKVRRENRLLRKSLDKLSRRGEPSHLQTYGPKIPVGTGNSTGSPKYLPRHRSHSNPALNNPIQFEPPEFKYEGEADRLDLDRGGHVKEASIYEIDAPFVGGWQTARPMYGQRMEDYAGDVMGAPLVIPHLIKDTWHNLHRDKYNLNKQQWEDGQNMTVELNPGGPLGVLPVLRDTTGSPSMRDNARGELKRYKSGFDALWNKITN